MTKLQEKLNRELAKATVLRTLIDESTKTGRPLQIFRDSEIGWTEMDGDDTIPSDLDYLRVEPAPVAHYLHPRDLPVPCLIRMPSEWSEERLVVAYNNLKGTVDLGDGYEKDLRELAEQGGEFSSDRIEWKPLCTLSDPI